MRRWLAYPLLGLAFGVLDWFFLQLLAAAPWQETFAPFLFGQVIGLVLLLGLDLGIWLVPVVALVIYETRASGSRWRAVLTGILVWRAAVVAYYFTYAALLMFWGLPHMGSLLFSNRHVPGYWANWFEVFQRLILGGIMEYALVAVIGGGVVSLLTNRLYTHFARKRAGVVRATTAM